MADAASFEEISREFDERVRRIVWCTVSTVDAKGRPFSRILHPIWEGATGWIATGRHSLKARHLERQDVVALCYWDPAQDTVIAQCRAQWCDDPPTRRRVWQLLRDTPPPVGYDPGLFWRGGDADPGYGVLRLTPLRVELWTGKQMLEGLPPTRWRASA